MLLTKVIYVYYILVPGSGSVSNQTKAKTNIRQERKLKKLATASENANKDLSCDNASPIEIPFISNIKLELTGDETVDKKLKDLKKVELLKRNSFCDGQTKDL